MTPVRSSRVAVGPMAKRLSSPGPLWPLFLRVGRFAGVGVACSLAYALAVGLATSGLGVRPDLSSVLAYGITVPLNFLLHRSFTFRSASDVRGDLARYGLAQVVNALVSYVAMAICVDAFGLSYGFGILAVILFVPIVTYLVLDRWVFAKKVVQA